MTRSSHQIFSSSAPCFTAARSPLGATRWDDKRSSESQDDPTRPTVAFNDLGAALDEAGDSRPPGSFADLSAGLRCWRLIMPIDPNHLEPASALSPKGFH